ncbi:KHG/KDPG aldolase-like isoform X3 [Salvia splendens]|uniref:KHG/KDPG aldolase-like isoform X3 n=1 Tax=Salvia splendens TaxID=180675 RepID=UPI001C2558C5|nr:KHG/KDPG aldolase-like isoform X3 [Salvia splendens]
MIVPIANKVGIRVSTRIDTCRSSLFCSKNSSVSLHPINVADTVLMDIQNSGIIACLRAKRVSSGGCACSTPGWNFRCCKSIESVGYILKKTYLRSIVFQLEITMSTPGVFEALQCLVQEYPSASIGVGTVLDRREAKEAVDLGAKFLMSPAMVKGILSDVAEGQALYIPGATTPTEVLSASTDGAKIITVYPVSVSGGVEYLAALKKPFPHIPLVASQGMGLVN